LFFKIWLSKDIMNEIIGSIFIALMIIGGGWLSYFLGRDFSPAKNPKRGKAITITVTILALTIVYLGETFLG